MEILLGLLVLRLSNNSLIPVVMVLGIMAVIVGGKVLM
jgi:hypothetical protein